MSISLILIWHQIRAWGDAFNIRFLNLLIINKPIGAAPGRDYYLLKICVVAKRMVRTTINLVGTLHVVRYVHHKRGGMLRRGYGLKEQEMTM